MKTGNISRTGMVSKYCLVLLFLSLAVGFISVCLVRKASAAEVYVNCGRSSPPDKSLQPLLAWFPRALAGWRSCPGEIFLKTESLLQIHKKYSRISDGAELEILVLAVTGASSNGKDQALTDPAWGKIAMVMGGETFYCQGYKGILITQDGKTVLKFILRDKHLEIDLMLDKDDKDAVKRYGSLLDIKKAASLFFETNSTAGNSHE